MSATDPTPPPADPPLSAEEAQLVPLLAWALPPGRPTAPVRDRLLGRARAVPVVTLTQADGPWRRIAPGVEERLLFVDAAERWETCLWRLGPGTRQSLVADGDDLVAIALHGQLAVAARDGTPARALPALHCLAGVGPAPVTLTATEPAVVLVVRTRGGGGGDARTLAVVDPAASTVHALTPHVTARRLLAGPSPRPDITLIDVTPGGVLPPHDHPETEEVFCLEGRCWSHGVPLEPGDYQRTRAGSPHDATTSATGSRLLVLHRPAV